MTLSARHGNHVPSRLAHLERENERLRGALDERRIADQCAIDEAVAAATKIKDAEVERLRTIEAAAQKAFAKIKDTEIERLHAEIKRLRAALRGGKMSDDPVERAMQKVEEQGREIQRLREALDQCRAALRPFAAADRVSLVYTLGHISREHIAAARAAVDEAEGK